MFSRWQTVLVKERTVADGSDKTVLFVFVFCSQTVYSERKNCKARTEFQQSSSLLFRIPFSKCKTVLVKERTVPVRGTRQSSNSSSLCFLFKWVPEILCLFRWKELLVRKITSVSVHAPPLCFVSMYFFVFAYLLVHCVNALQTQKQGKTPRSRGHEQ